jgi:hypothetical protein
MTDPNQERIAHELRRHLGGDARVVGGGVHWSVEVSRAQRACTIVCFWYGNASGPARTGAEYLVSFRDATRQVAGGRTHDMDAVLAAVQHWLDGKTLADVEQQSPFVDKRRRRMRELLAALGPACGDAVRCEIERSIRFELWAYGTGRSCQLHVGEGDTVSASFLLGPAQVAFGDVTADPAAPISRWLHGAALAELAASGIALEAHAELLENGDTTRWHWSHVRDRTKDPTDVLASSRPLVERLAERELPTRFFSYSSMSRFCFSASSHYPWVDRDLPVIYPPHGSSGYVVEVGTTRTECEIDRAVEVIERALAACPLAPFFGSAAHVTIAPLDTLLAAAGTSLRAELRQRSQWFEAAVVQGDRRCAVVDDLCSATFHDPADPVLHASFSRPADTIAAIRCWLEDRCGLDEIKALPSLVRSSTEGGSSNAN